MSSLDSFHFIHKYTPGKALCLWVPGLRDEDSSNLCLSGLLMRSCQPMFGEFLEWSPAHSKLQVKCFAIKHQLMDIRT